MKNLINKFIIGIAISGTFTNISLAERLTKKEVINNINRSVQTTNFPSIVQKLNEGVPVETQYFVSQTGVPYDLEGVPESFTVSPQPDVYNGYSTAELIKVTLEEAQYFVDGERLTYFLDSMDYVKEVSGRKGTEVLTRTVLNRAKDIINLTLPMVGYNYDFIRGFYNRFLKESYILGAAYLNNHIGIEGYLSSSYNTSVADYIETYSMADFSFQYAQMLLKYSQSLTTESSQAIILARLLSYIVWDLNLDKRRRSPGILQTLSDIHRLQRTKIYRAPLMNIENDLEPTQAQVARLRSRVQMILDRMVERIPGIAGLTLR